MLRQTKGQEDLEPSKKVTYDLLQKPLVHHAQCFSCHMKISYISLLCNLWNHQKKANVPHIHKEQEMSIEDCKQIATKNKFFKKKDIWFELQAKPDPKSRQNTWACDF